MNITSVIRRFAPAINDERHCKKVTIDPVKYPDPIRGICIHDHLLYVVKGYQILEVNESGDVKVLCGTKDAGHKDGPVHEAQFSKWCRLATDRHGNIFVTDPCNYAIRMVHKASRRVVTIAGQVGQKDYVDHEEGRFAKFRWPLGITVDCNNNVYVADHSAIRKLTPRDPDMLGGETGEIPAFSVSTIIRKPGKYFADVCYDHRKDVLYFRSEHVIYKYDLAGDVGAKKEETATAHEVVHVDFDMGAMCHDPATDTILMNRRSLYMLQSGQKEDKSDNLVQKLLENSGERGWALAYDKARGLIYAATSDHEITTMHMM